VESVVSFKYSIILSTNRDDLTSAFLFISFSCLISLASNYSTILNKSGESGPLCLVLNLGGNDLFFSI
jgi:hypothetical protein